MVDWAAAKNEYITTACSYRDIAKRYKVNPTNVAKKGKAEDWVGERKRFEAKTQARIESAVGASQASRAARLQTVADKVLNRVERYVENAGDDLDTTSMKDITRILKDLKDVQMIRSNLDLREQEARIANLEKQANETAVDAADYGVVLMPDIEPLKPPDDEDGAADE